MEHEHVDAGRSSPLEGSQHISAGTALCAGHCRSSPLEGSQPERYGGSVAEWETSLITPGGIATQ